MATGKIIQADKIQGLADVPNFLSNPNGLLNTSGWTEGSYTAGTRPTGSFTASSGAGKFSISRTTTNPLGMTGTSLVFTKSSGNQQGRAVETIFALPLDYRAKVLKLSASYINTSTNATDFVAGSNTTDSDMIFYTAFSTDGGSTYTVAEPSSIKLLSNSKDNSDPFTGSYQTPYNATHLKFIAYVATTSTTAWSIKAVCSVSPSNYVYGTPITDWVSYTPTGNWSTGTATYTGRWRKVGDSIEVQAVVSLSGAPTAADFTVNIPAGLTIDVSKIPSASVSMVLGSAEILDSGVRVYAGTVVYAGTTSVYVNHTEAGNSGLVNATNPTTFGAADTVSLNFKVPILGWSSSVQVSDGYDGRVVATKMYPSANLTVAPNNGTAKLNLNAFSTDKAGFANTTLNRIDIKVSGTFNIKGTLELAGTNVLANTQYRLYINKNGAGWRFGGIYYAPSNGAGLSLIADFPEEDLIAGDYLEAYIHSNGNHSVNQLTVVGGSNTVTSMSIEKLAGNPVISATEVVAFSGRHTAGQSIPRIISTSVNLNSVVTVDTHGAYRSGSGYNSTTGVWTVAPAWVCSSPGVYGASFNADYASAAISAGAEYNITIVQYRNGSAINAPTIYDFPKAAITTIQTIPTLSYIFDMQAGDEIRFQVYHNESANRSLYTNGINATIFKVK